MIWGIFGALLSGLVVVHMAKPKGELHEMSSARFFDEVPAPRKGTSRLSLNSLRNALPFWVQLLCLSLICAAFVLGRKQLPGFGSVSLNLLVFIDVSASTQTVIQDQLAHEWIAAALVETLAPLLSKPYLDLSIRLIPFDRELHEPFESNNLFEAIPWLKNLKPGFLNTDLGCLRSELAKAEAAESKITHILVFTDQNAPSWIENFHQKPLYWRRVIDPVSNLGIADVSADRNPLTGWVEAVEVVIAHYGPYAPTCHLEVRGPSGAALLETDVQWQGSHAYQSFKTKGPGLYHILIYPGGAYPLDDSATLFVSTGAQPCVSWSGHHPLGAALGWQDCDQPQLRITSDPEEYQRNPQQTTLLLGAGYEREPCKIADFVEGDPLLDQLNFDALEQVRPKPAAPPADWTPVLTDDHGRVWLAHSPNHQGVWVPGPPQGEGVLYGVSLTLFFNAFRRQILTHPLDPLFEPLRRPDEVPHDQHLALYPGEGDSWREPVDERPPIHLEPAQQQQLSPASLPLLTLALLLLAFERRKNIFGGYRWH